MQRPRVPRPPPQADDDAPKKGKEKRSWDEGESKNASSGKGKVELAFLALALTLNPRPKLDTEPTQVEHGILPPTLPLSRPVSTFRTRRRGGRAATLRDLGCKPV